MVPAKESDGRQPVVSLILLTAVTGFVDAASFLGLQHVFTGTSRTVLKLEARTSLAPAGSDSRVDTRSSK
jgi:hypothetical protein